MGGESTDAAGRARAAMRLVLFGLILITPLPFGSVQHGAVSLVQVAAALLGAGALWVLRSDPRALSPAGRRAAVPALLLVAVGLAQLLPVPGAVVRALAAPTAEIRHSVWQLVPQAVSDYAPLSLSPADTRDAVMRLAAYVLIGLAAAVSFPQHRQMRRAAVVVAVAGTLQALYGSMEYLSGHQQILGYRKTHYLDSATGTFINRNHFASYLAITLPFALAPLFAAREKARRADWRRRVLELAQPANLRNVLAGAAGFAIVAGVLLSYSRAGLAAALFGAVVLAVTGARRSRRRFAWGPALVLALPLAVLSMQEIRTPGGRFAAEAEELASLNSRLPFWSEAASMIAVRPALGSGLGTFEAAFRLSQPADLDKRLVHLHNDWLQTGVEGGAPAVLAALWLGVALWRGGLRGLRVGPRRATLAAATLAALAAIAAHALIDFPLRIPAIAVLAACLAGWSVGGWAEAGDSVAPFGRAARSSLRDVRS